MTVSTRQPTPQARPIASANPSVASHLARHATPVASDTPIAPSASQAAALPPVLSIAGSDSCGGAGIQADIKTMLACDVYAMTAITAITAQNTTGVTAIAPTSPDMLAAQIDAVFDDVPPVAVKIGMVPDRTLIGVIADRLAFYRADKVVLDTVMVASSGARLIDRNATKAMVARLLPLATLITPNLPETAVLLDSPIEDIRGHDAMRQAAAELERRYGCAVLVKGGHSGTDADDVLVSHGGVMWFEGAHINNPNTHGTGCTLSSAIASFLARGETLPDAITDAKAYLTGALRAGLDLGHGSGPVDHAWNRHMPYHGHEAK